MWKRTPTPPRRRQSQYRCSFCGKGQDDVNRLIAGPGAVYICDECIALCTEILEEDTELPAATEMVVSYVSATSDPIQPRWAQEAYELYVADNAQELQRLQAQLGQLSESDLSKPLPHGWTVAAALMHCAFWDRIVLLRWESWEREGINWLQTLELDTLNNALLPQWLVVPLDETKRQVLEASNSVDRKIASLPARLVEEYINEGKSTWMLHTAGHRREHLNEIERALAQDV